MSIDAPLIRKLTERKDLEADEIHAVIDSIVTGSASESQIAAFIAAMSMKGETTEEVSAAVKAMRAHSSHIDIDCEHLVDIVGTGGDGQQTFNISTTSAFVVAAAGGNVAKHGTRSVLSTCGSADLLELAGVNLDLSPSQVHQCVEKIGIGFLFAPNYHPALKNTLATRQALGIRSLFNILAPLLNPAGAKHQLLGVYKKSWCLVLAKVLHKLGSEHVLVVHADDGLDEISINAPTFVAELNHGEIRTYTITPEEFGLSRQSLSSLTVSNPAESVELFLSVLQNRNCAARDIVILNAGAAIYAANCCESLAQGIELARDALTCGKAESIFFELKALSHQF